MKPIARLLALVVTMACLVTAATGRAQQKEPEDKTLSPYFFVQSDDPEVDRLPLKATSATVNISGVIADVRVTQVYKNEGKHALEAIYIFPGSTRAAVYAMKMTIGERVINAKIRKRDEARQEYEQAKQQGKSASLLEQQRPNVFQMNVANIMPGDEIKVEMSYTELLVPTDKIYEFVYPTVAGPRYSNQKASTAPSSEHWVQNPYLHEGEAAPYTFDITTTVHAGLPIRELSCTSHKVKVRYEDPDSAKVFLEKSEAQGGNRDYILKYRLAGDQVETGLLLSKSKKENFFLLMLQPPKRVTLAQIPGREYIFIVDVSGSMHGFPLEISKTLLKDLIGSLRPSDLFNVVLFAGGSTVMSEHSVPANQENINRAISVIDRQRGGGGTEILPALDRALKLPRPENFSRTIMIATDGYVTVEEQVFDLMRNNLGTANMFAFGIGSTVNRHLIEGMAHVGMGEPFVITRPEEAPAKAKAFRRLIQSPVLTNVKVTFKGFDVYDLEPRSIPDVLSDRPVIVFGKWRGEPRGSISVSGIAGEERYHETIDVAKAVPNRDQQALQYLWTRHRIMLLSDYNMLRRSDDRIKEVTNLGIAYNLLTAYTSFIAVDSEVRNAGGKQTTVNQPLPLPQGVSDYAVGVMGFRASAMPSAATGRAFAHAEAAPSTSVMERKAAAGYGYVKLADTRSKEEKQTTIKELVVIGGLPSDAVRKAIDHQAGSLKGCAALGNVQVKIVINADGTVKSAEVVSKELKGHVRQCILEAIRKWKFAPSSGQETNVTVTLVFGS